MVEQAPDWVDGEARQAADRDRDTLLDELAALPEFDYEQRRAEEARNLHVCGNALDAEVERRRTALRGTAPLFGHWMVEPWSEPVDGDALLTAVVNRVQRHVVLSYEQAATVALWVLLAWSHEAAVHSPLLLVTSAEANSGKSTLLELIGFMSPRGLSSVSLSQAALYRALEAYQPTFLIDEADVAFVENEELRTVVNSGWTKGSGVIRNVGDNHEPHLFPTFCPKLIALKGRKLPDTTLSRCIIVEMRRKKPSESSAERQRATEHALPDIPVAVMLKSD